jgi:hypothetical protein
VRWSNRSGVRVSSWCAAWRRGRRVVSVQRAGGGFLDGCRQGAACGSVVFAGGNRWRRRRRRCRRLGERSRRAVRRRADKEAAEAASSRAEPSGRPATAGVWNLDAVILRLSSFLVVRWAARRGRGVCLSQKTVLGGAWDGGLVGV